MTNPYREPSIPQSYTCFDCAKKNKRIKQLKSTVEMLTKENNDLIDKSRFKAEGVKPMFSWRGYVAIGLLVLCGIAIAYVSLNKFDAFDKAVVYIIAGAIIIHEWFQAEHRMMKGI